jgi:hypothetical protein
LENSTTDVVDLDLHDALQRLVLQDFLGDAAVAAADDQHVLRLAVRQDRHVGHHLVIDELVARGDLRGAVEHQHLAEVLLLEQHEVLVLGLLLVKHLVDREGHAEAEVVEQRLGKPAFVGHHLSFRTTSSRRPQGDPDPSTIRRRKLGNGPGSRPDDIPKRNARDKPGHANSHLAWKLTPLPAQVLADHDALGLERLAQHRDAGLGLGVAAHEHVECGVVRLGQEWIEMWLSASTATPDTPPFGSK